MASPEWFFSTLAQSSAALIGFIIAIATVQYQFERRRIDKRTEELREEYKNLNRKYSGTFLSLLIALRSYLDDPEKLDEFIQAEHIDEKANQIRNHNETDPRVAEAYLYLSHLDELLFKIGPSNNSKKNYLIQDSDLNELQDFGHRLRMWFLPPESQREATKGLEEIYSGINDEDEMAITEFARELDLDTGVDYSTYIFENEDFRGDDLYEIQVWLDEYVENNSDYADLTGLNLESIQAIFGSFTEDIDTIFLKTGDTILDYESEITSILELSFLLAVVGVLVPIAVLLTIPIDFYLTGWPLLVLEGLTVLGVVVLLWKIVQKLVSDLAP